MTHSSRLRLSQGPLARPIRAVRYLLPPVNFITLHYTYFIATCLVSAIIFWGSSTPPRSVSFTDSLFLCVSAMTLAGLNTINLSQLNTWQQIMLFLLIILGSAILVSAVTVHVRKRAFEKKFASIIAKRKAASQRRRTPSASGFSLRTVMSFAKDPHPAPEDNPESAPAEKAPSRQSRDRSMSRGRNQSTRTVTSSDNPPVVARESDSDVELDESNQPHPDRVTFSAGTRFRSPKSPDLRQRHNSIFSAHGVGARSLSGPHSSATLQTATYKPDHIDGDPFNRATGLTNKYFPSSGYISRNSRFYGLSEAEREELGGVEYKAVCFLSWLVPLYFVLFQLLGCIGLAAYVAINRPAAAQANALNPWWVGAFNGVSAFNNSGMSLLDANMTAFQTSYYMCLTMGLMILAGNTCYPIFLRLVIWSMLKLMPKAETWDDKRTTLRFLLDHPRRCYTHLFPSEHTWWLALLVIVLNGTDWAAFEILNIGNKALDDALPLHIRVLDGFFQALAVRSGGFYVVSIPTLRVSLQLLYVVMMYISVYPVVITMRNSNVYEERSLGIYADDPGYKEEELENASGAGSIWSVLKNRLLTGGGKPSPTHEGTGYFLNQQLRAQHAHDGWWIVLAVFLIMIIENTQFESSPTIFSVFNVLFEVVSAYGTVGISVGVPYADYSFCGAWHTLSKLILCAVMLRGRHRGLPVALDKAVLLPHEKLGHAEEEDAMIGMERLRSRRDEGAV